MSTAAIIITALDVAAAFANAYAARQKALAAQSQADRDAAMAEMDAMFEQANTLHLKLQAEQVKG